MTERQTRSDASSQCIMQLETLHNILQQGIIDIVLIRIFLAKNLSCSKGYQLKFDSYKLFLGAVEEFSAFTFSDFKKNTLTRASLQNQP